MLWILASHLECVSCPCGWRVWRSCEASSVWDGVSRVFAEGWDMKSQAFKDLLVLWSCPNPPVQDNRRFLICDCCFGGKRGSDSTQSESEALKLISWEPSDAGSLSSWVICMDRPVFRAWWGWGRGAPQVRATVSWVPLVTLHPCALIPYALSHEEEDFRGFSDSITLETFQGNLPTFVFLASPLPALMTPHEKGNKGSIWTAAGEAWYRNGLFLGCWTWDHVTFNREGEPPSKLHLPWEVGVVTVEYFTWASLLCSDGMSSLHERQGASRWKDPMVKEHDVQALGEKKPAPETPFPTSCVWHDALLGKSSKKGLVLFSSFCHVGTGTCALSNPPLLHWERMI